LNRREFIKIAGITTAAAGATLALKPKDLVAMSKGKEHNDFPVKLDPDLKPFDQKNYAFMRIFWDKEPVEPYIRDTFGFETIQELGLTFKATHDGLIPLPPNTAGKKGYRKIDKALELAAWSVNAHFAYESELGVRNSVVQTYPVDHITRKELSSEPVYVKGLYSWDNSRAAEQKMMGLFNEFKSSEEAAKYVKKASLHLGADLVGIAPYNERTKNWVYGKWAEPKLKKYPMPNGKSRYLPLDAQKFMRPPEQREYGVFGVDEAESNFVKEAGFEPKSVIVLAFEMDYDAMKSIPTLVGASTVGKEYSRMAEASHKVAEFLREMGYNAAPCGNDTALSVPLAIEAGLGEGSRMGLLITEKYGPRVRLAKVFTDLEIKPDKPKTFGVKAFCNVCMKCADACPGKAISHEPAQILREGMEFSTGKITKSQMKGVEKWFCNSVRCLAFWAYNGADCATCISVCPYNKIEEWHHQLSMIMTLTPFKPLLRSLDEWFGYGGPISPDERFDSKYIHDAVDDFWNKS
jgi:reductive dehalogenase